MRRPRLDWREPDYTAVFAWRLTKLEEIRKQPEVIPGLRAYYREHPWDFIEDWGTTFDPRNPERDLPALMPFCLFPRQREWCQWLYESWRASRPGVTPKSRDVGVTWLAVAMACTLCLHWDGLAIGFGSRKLELVDKLGDPDSIFWKAREFMSNLPHEFRRGWTRDDAPEKRIMFRATGSIIKGEGGDEIGRGGRSSIYFVDEASKLAHPMLAEASLSATTNCRQDLATANGIGNIFYDKVHKWPDERVFRFHWRDDPRKDDAWYDKQKDELDPVVLAQEVDIDFTASLEGVLIPSAWVQAAIGADAKLGLHPTGDMGAALDVADEGADLCALLGGRGHTLQFAEEWSGKGGDIYYTTVKAMDYSETWGASWMRYDADGLGAGVRGDARVVNDERLKAGRPRIRVVKYQGSGGVVKPTGEDVKGRKNEDFFKNLKAQAWWHGRSLFYHTWRAVTQGVPFTTDQIVSLNPEMQHLTKLTQQLSQPTFTLNNEGKVVVDKAPEGAKSPNLADAAIMRLARLPMPMEISDEALVSAGQRSPLRRRAA